MLLDTFGRDVKTNSLLLLASPFVYRRLYDWGYALYPQSYKHLYFFQFSAYIFSADIKPGMLKLGRVTKVKVFFLVLVYVFNVDLFEFSAAILEKGLLFN